MESFLLGLKWTGRQHSFRGTILLLFLRTAPSHLVVSEKVVLQNFDYAVAVSDYWRSPCFFMYGFARTGFQRGSVLLTAHRVLNADFDRVVRNMREEREKGSCSSLIMLFLVLFNSTPSIPFWRWVWEASHLYGSVRCTKSLDQVRVQFSCRCSERKRLIY